MAQSRNLEVEALRRQMESAYERAKKLPSWLTRGQFLVEHERQLSAGTEQAENRQIIAEPTND